MDKKENKEIVSSETNNIWKKTAGLGKKMVLGVQNTAKTVTEHTKMNIRDKQLKKYNPLSAEKFFSKDFNIPNIVEIVDDAIRRDIKVCEGAIGWTDMVNGVEILHLYDEWVKDSGLCFIPFAKCDSVYCVDSFDRTKFINAENIFERSAGEKIAELENIAYCLGAKSCSIEIVEQNESSQAKTLRVSRADNSFTTNSTAYSQNISRQSGKNISHFEGNRAPCEPNLKWFAYDDNVKGLVDMKCNGNNSIKSKVIELSCSTSTTMSQKAAGAIDKLLKVKSTMSLEKKAIKEHSSKLIFEILF